MSEFGAKQTLCDVRLESARRPKTDASQRLLSLDLANLNHAKVASFGCPGIADRFTPSAQGRLLWRGMTTGSE